MPPAATLAQMRAQMQRDFALRFPLSDHFPCHVYGVKFKLPTANGAKTLSRTHQHQHPRLTRG